MMKTILADEWQIIRTEHEKLTMVHSELLRSSSDHIEAIDKLQEENREITKDRDARLAEAQRLNARAELLKEQLSEVEWSKRSLQHMEIHVSPRRDARPAGFEAQRAPREVRFASTSAVADRL